MTTKASPKKATKLQAKTATKKAVSKPSPSRKSAPVKTSGKVVKSRVKAKVHVEEVAREIKTPEKVVHRQKIGKQLRFEVFKRDGFTCQYCGAKAPDVVLNVDHVNPVAAGGTNDITNLVTSCVSCNLGKGDVLTGQSRAGKKTPEKIRSFSKTQKGILNRAAIHDKFLLEVKGEDAVLSGIPEQEPLIVGKFGTSRYMPEYCDLLLQWMGEGRSFDTFGVAIYRATHGQILPRREYLYVWLEKHPEFAETKEAAEVLRRQWWEEHGISNMYYDKNASIQFNDRLWYNNMRNYFKWGENVNVNQNTDMKITVTTSIPRPALQQGDE